MRTCVFLLCLTYFASDDCSLLFLAWMQHDLFNSSMQHFDKYILSHIKDEPYFFKDTDSFVLDCGGILLPRAMMLGSHDEMLYFVLNTEASCIIQLSLPLPSP